MFLIWLKIYASIKYLLFFRRAMKATALLFPLLGITHLLFCVNPRDDSKLEEAYMITNAVLQSSQVSRKLTTSKICLKSFNISDIVLEKMYLMHNILSF